MVDGCDSDVALRFSALLEGKHGLLLTLDALPAACRGLAFAVRAHLLVKMPKHRRFPATADWAAIIDSLDRDCAVDVLRAVIRGLVVDDEDHMNGESDFSHLRRDCARMLAVISDPLVSPAKLRLRPEPPQLMTLVLLEFNNSLWSRSDRFSHNSVSSFILCGLGEFRLQLKETQSKPGRGLCAAEPLS
jgi:hypothetical protein